MNPLSDNFQADGVACFESVVSTAMLQRLCDEFEEPFGNEAQRRGGRRHLLRLPLVRELAEMSEIRTLVEQVLSPKAFAVRAVLFDKHPDSNWSIRWHRDATITVAERRDVAGFAGWSEKDGVQHVRPPAEVLRGMVAVRVHLDDCPVENGALQVVVGSHLLPVEAERPVDGTVRICPVGRGGVLLMRPLCWHASSKAEAPARRRVLHIEYADGPLPVGLAWGPA